MTEEQVDKDQPMIIEEAPFIVKVKLLSNEVYEITTKPDVKLE